MITCYIRYVTDIHKAAEFERYSRMWLTIIPRLSGTHHGYFLPSEGAIDIALALFSFPSLADYERYRTALETDPEAQTALEFARETRCFLRYDRSFFRPLLPDAGASTLPSPHNQELS
jgi:hypothetical protein